MTNKAKDKISRARQIARTLDIEDGDVVLVKVDTLSSHQVQIAQMQSHLARTGRRNCLVGVVDSFEDITVLNEDDMNRLGWMRIPNWQAQGKGEA